jgi:hypothetical protein
VQYDIYETDYVDGDCRMWDIPVTIRYHFFPSRSFSFFVSVGTSSYLMEEENYAFEVQSGYGNQQYDMQVKNGNREWFKMMNLSIGIHKKLTDRFALQLEPFAKVPLSGVGAGRIELASFGTFLGIQYQFVKNKGK